MLETRGKAGVRYSFLKAKDAPWDAVPICNGTIAWCVLLLQKYIKTCKYANSRQGWFRYNGIESISPINRSVAIKAVIIFR